MRSFACIVLFIWTGCACLAQLPGHTPTRNTSIPDYEWKEFWAFGWKENQVQKAPCPLTVQQRRDVVQAIRLKTGSTEPVLVQSWLEGFFTSPGGTEQVMLLLAQDFQSSKHVFVAIYDRDSKHISIADGNGVVDADTTLLKAYVDPGSKLDAILVFSPISGGPTKERAKLVEYSGATLLKVVKDFGAVIADDCQSTSDANGRIIRSTILYLPQGGMEFRRRHYGSTCRDRSSGQLLGIDDMDETQFLKTHGQNGGGQ